MSFQKIIFFIGIVLSTALVALSRGHSDCDHHKIFKNIVNMCNSCTYSSNIKREATTGTGTEMDLNPALQRQLDGNDGVDPQVPSLSSLRQDSPSGFYFPSQLAPNYELRSIQEQNKRIDAVAAATFEPKVQEPIEALNFILNPVLADLSNGLQRSTSVKRWRKRSHIEEELENFVRTGCCLTGCRFEDYCRLNRRLKIC